MIPVWITFIFQILLHFITRHCFCLLFMYCLIVFFMTGYDLIRSHSQPVEAAVEPLERWDSYENFNNLVEDNSLEGIKLITVEYLNEE